MFQYQGNNFCNKLGITLCNLQILIWDVLCVWRGKKTQPNSDKPNKKKIHKIPKPEIITTGNKRKLKASNAFGVVIIEIVFKLLLEFCWACSFMRVTLLIRS